MAHCTVKTHRKMTQCKSWYEATCNICMMYCVDNSCTSPEHTAPVCVPQCNDVGWTVGSATTVRQTAQNKQFQQQHTGYLHIYTALTKTWPFSRATSYHQGFEFNFLQFRYLLFGGVNFLTEHAIKVIIENSIFTFPSKNICWWKTLYYCIDANFFLKES